MSPSNTLLFPRPVGAVRMLLSAHEGEPEPTADPTPDAPQPDPIPDPDPAPKPDEKPEPAKLKDDEPKLGTSGQKALEREREARKAAAAAARKAEAELAAAQKKIADFEDGQRSDLEKAQAAAERAQAAATAANRRVVTSELRSAAIGAEALDPSDVVGVLGHDPDRFIVDGVVDATAIEQAVGELLGGKPHWLRQAIPDPGPAPKASPKPDPSQGSRGPTPPVDLMSLPREDFDAAMATEGIRSRRR